MSTNIDSRRMVPSKDPLGMTLSLPMSRRDILRVGFFSTAGLLFGGRSLLPAAGPTCAANPVPAAQALASAPVKAKAKSVIQVFLWGGMSHNDTWAPNPDSGYDY